MSILSLLKLVEYDRSAKSCLICNYQVHIYMWLFPNLHAISFVARPFAATEGMLYLLISSILTAISQRDFDDQYKLEIEKHVKI